MIRNGHRRLARSFNLCYRYIDDLIVINNKKFLDYLKVSCMRQTMLTQSGAPGRVIGWNNSSH